MRKLQLILALLIVFTMVVSACGGRATPTPEPAAPAAEEPAAEEPAAEEPAAEEPAAEEPAANFGLYPMVTGQSRLQRRPPSRKPPHWPSKWLPARCPPWTSACPSTRS